MKTRPRTMARLALLTVVGIALTLIVAFPLYWMALTSVAPLGSILSKQPSLLPPIDQLSVAAFETALFTKGAWRWLVNSAIVTAMSTALGIAMSVPAAYAISRLQGRAQRGLGFSLFLGRTIPATVLVLPIYVVYQATGLLNSFAGLALANAATTIPFSVWLLKGSFDAIPYELEEASMIDGNGLLGAIGRVVLPLSLPGIAATTIYSAVTSWGEYMFAATFLRSPENWTMTVGLVTYMGEHGTDWNGLMAASLITLIPLVLLFLVLISASRNDLSRGALK